MHKNVEHNLSAFVKISKQNIANIRLIEKRTKSLIPLKVLFGRILSTEVIKV